MSRVVDNVIAYKIISMLVKPFEETDAYKLGIIDKNGHNLIKSNEFTTFDQKNAYTFLDRLIFSLKRIINRFPGGENKLKSLATALYLVKEHYEKNERSIQLLESRFNTIMNIDAVLVEETILVEKCMKKLEEDGGAGGVGGGAAPTGIANTTGPNVSTDIPVPSKKDISKYKKKNVGGVISFARRNNKVM